MKKNARTIERYLETNDEELGANGYVLIKGLKLKVFKDEIKEQSVRDIDINHKVRNLGIFDFRSFLNIAMLLSESKMARILRQTILDIVIDIINQRDEEFIQASFTNVLKNFLDMSTFK